MSILLWIFAFVASLLGTDFTAKLFFGLTQCHFTSSINLAWNLEGGNIISCSIRQIGKLEYSIMSTCIPISNLCHCNKTNMGNWLFYLSAALQLVYLQAIGNSIAFITLNFTVLGKPKGDWNAKWGYILIFSSLILWHIQPIYCNGPIQTTFVCQWYKCTSAIIL